jgi:hypothetical protein
MYPLNQLKTLVSCGRDPARSLPFRRGFLLIPLILLCFALSPNAQAARDPAILLQRHQPVNPDPGVVGGVLNTADGLDALISATSGAFNSAFGTFSQLSLTTGNFNTAVGVLSLDLNNADSNTAIGFGTLLLNTVGTGPNTGTQNTAVGVDALFNNTGGANDGDGSFNDAVGVFALVTNTTGFSNNALGNSALFLNTIGADNTAVGDVALAHNDESGAGLANFNTAVGAGALFNNGDGDSNNAVGFNAMGSNVDGLFNNAMGFDALADNVGGAGNVAIGDSVGLGNTSGSFNTYVGVNSATIPDGESDTVRIGDPAFGVACFVGGIFGVPVSGSPVVVDANGQLGTAAAGSPLSMKELLKQRQVVQELKATTERQAAVIALQEGQINALTAGLKQQADQIQKVSAQLEMIRPTPRVVENR